MSTPLQNNKPRRTVGSADDPASHLLQVLWRAGWPPLLVFAVNLLATWLRWYPPGMDDVMHYTGGIAIAWFYHQLALGFPRILGKPSRLLFTLMLISLATSTAVIWEFGEYLVEPYVDIVLQPSLPDTLLDLLLGICGAVSYALTRIGTTSLLPTPAVREARIR